MTYQGQELILGTPEDNPILSSSDHVCKLLLTGDTLCIRNRRTPDDKGYEGEITWDVASGVASIYLCSVSCVEDEDGDILTPAVWNKLDFTAPRMVKK